MNLHLFRARFFVGVILFFLLATTTVAVVFFSQNRPIRTLPVVDTVPDLPRRDAETVGEERAMALVDTISAMPSWHMFDHAGDEPCGKIEAALAIINQYETEDIRRAIETI